MDNYKPENDRHAAYKNNINRPLMTAETALRRVGKVKEFTLEGLSKIPLGGGKVHTYLYAKNG